MVSNHSPLSSRSISSFPAGQAVSSAEQTTATSSTEEHPLTDLQAQAELKGRVRGILKTSYTHLSEMAEAVSQQFSTNSTIQEKKDAFRNANVKNIETIQKKGWNALKEERGMGMTRVKEDESVSMQEFRDAANALVDDITAEMGKELGLPDVKWTACGTVGYNSDVDTALLGPKEGIGTGDACLYKTLRDLVHVSIFGAPSGIQLDTESYIPHPAESKTLEFLVPSKESERAFQTHELANAAFQRYESLAKHPADYEASKQADLESISDAEQREVMETVYAQVEAFMEHVDGLVNAKLLEQEGVQTDDLTSEVIQLKAHDIIRGRPDAYKNGREVVIVPLRMSLAEKCDQIEKEITEVQTRILKEVSGKVDSQKLNELLLDKNRAYSLLCLLQDEGTHSQAEGKATLFQEGGQIHVGAQQRAQKEISKKTEHQSGVIGHLITEEWGGVLEALYLNSLRDVLTPKGFEKPTLATLINAAHEEGAQFEHVVHDELGKQDKERPQSVPEAAIKAAIKSGKYCLRMGRNHLFSLAELKKEYKQRNEGLPKGLRSLLARANKLEDQAFQLERCKRKSTLNRVATVKLLTSAIEARGRGAKDKVQVEARLNKIVREFEKGGKYFGKPMKKSEQMRILVKSLVDALYLDSNDVDMKNFTAIKERKASDQVEGILTILRARVGYKKEKEKHVDLIPLHKQADKITVESYNLTTPQAVEAFSAKVVKLGQDIRNFALDHGLMPKGSMEVAEQLDFIDLTMESLQEFPAPSV